MGDEYEEIDIGGGQTARKYKDGRMYVPMNSKGGGCWIGAD